MNSESKTTDNATILAAISAIEEPTEAMLKEAGRVCMYDAEFHQATFVDPHLAGLVWRAMIRAKRAELNG